MMITTGAELRTVRERLGLTQTWLASEMKISGRTYQLWEEDMRLSIPDKAGNTLEKLQRKVSRATWRMLDQIYEIIDERDEMSSHFVLIRYQKDEDLWRYRPDMKGMPASYYSVILDRVARELKADSIGVNIIYMNSEKYEAWLGDKDDSERMRFEWAYRDYAEKGNAR